MSLVSLFDALFTVGEIKYGSCEDESGTPMNLVQYYESLVTKGKASPFDADYLKKRIVGGGSCGIAIKEFLSKKRLVMS